MARRRSAGVAEDLFGIAAALPWWAGVILGAVAYAVLHRFAVAEVATTATPGQIGQMVVGQMTKSLAYAGQFIIPVLFLAGAAASHLGRRKRERLVSDSAQGLPGQTLRGMNWQEFELLVGEAFRLTGYSVAETGGGGADGGVDLVLKKGGELFLVQCKQWRAFKVSVTTVRELYGVMAARGAAGGFVVTSGAFTNDAQAFAEGRNIELIDGSALEAMIEIARGAQRPSTAAGEQAVLPDAATNVVSAEVATPTCPRCGAAMVNRIAKQGSNAGNAFWGCSGFPACRGVRPIA